MSERIIHIEALAHQLGVTLEFLIRKRRSGALKPLSPWRPDEITREDAQAFILREYDSIRRETRRELRRRWALTQLKLELDPPLEEEEHAKPRVDRIPLND